MRKSLLSASALTATIFGTTLTAVSLSGSPALAGPITAGDPALAPYTLQYGDFSIVSLQFADTGTGTNNYFVASSPGQIRSDIVVGTGAGGSFLNGTAGGSMTLSGSDAPYQTENGAGASYFATGNAVSAPDPGGANEFPNDTANSWDIKVSTLDTALGGQTPVFYFNLNETGTTDQLSGTDLLIWVKASLVNPSGGTDATFYLAGNPLDPNGAGYGKAQSIANGAPDATASYPDVPAGSTYDPTDPRWTYVHGDICINGTVFVHYGSCTNADAAGTQSVNQDLGANQAAFAGYSLSLDSLLFNPLYAGDTLQLDWEMADQDNGYEQLFILAGGAPAQIPEPLTISLFGVGIVGAATLFRRKKAKA
ncbi:MAG TPA: PEP-CTERM sorting domain-containing protein [Rhizomicrobium sp.]|jgi:hypothetical protein